MQQRGTLKKSQRLKSRKLLNELFQQGKPVQRGALRVLYQQTVPQKSSPQTGVLFGCGVSKKHFKKAVHRNRVKRLLREAWRLQQQPMQDLFKKRDTVLLLFALYTGRDLPDFNSIYQQIGLILQALQQTITELPATEQ